MTLTSDPGWKLHLSDVFDPSVVILTIVASDTCQHKVMWCHRSKGKAFGDLEVELH